MRPTTAAVVAVAVLGPSTCAAIIRRLAAVLGVVILALGVLKCRDWLLGDATPADAVWQPGVFCAFVVFAAVVWVLLRAVAWVLDAASGA